MKHLLLVLMVICLIAFSSSTRAAEPNMSEYSVGIDDVLGIIILQPEKMLTTVTVAPDGSISVPYIDNVQVKGMTLGQIQKEIQTRLAEGYMKYPVVSVSLRESRSRKFSVSGDVLRPGTYPIKENTTVLKAISMAGGFLRYGPSNQVKVLRPKKNETGYETIKVDIKDVTSSDSIQSLLIQPGDVIEVTAGKFSVYGEVVRPGPYPIEENITVLKAISMAGGFTKYGSSSRVKVLRPRTDGTGYENIKVNMNAVMKGDSESDILLQPEDTVVVSEGIF